MKKNKMMRTASALLVATLLSTSVIAGTFAKYTTSAEGSDTARVAKWGFDRATTISLDNLFSKTYTDTTNGQTVSASTDVIAPGTSGSATFGFTYGGSNEATAPEVAYTFEVSTKGSSCADAIKNNKNIVWYLDDQVAPAVSDGDSGSAEAGSWDALISAIEALDGNVDGNKYGPGTMPTAFYDETPNGAKTHKVSWEWKFNTDSNDSNVIAQEDTTDTNMGNAETLANVTLKITVTATQVD